MDENNKIDKEVLVRMIANRANFTQGDVRIILDTMIDVIADAISTETPVAVRGFFSLSYPALPERKGSPLTGGGMLPPTPRAVFRLAKNLRQILKNNDK